jgi:hypothetical protein
MIVICIHLSIVPVIQVPTAPQVAILDHCVGQDESMLFIDRPSHLYDPSCRVMRETTRRRLATLMVPVISTMHVFKVSTVSSVPVRQDELLPLDFIDRLFQIHNAFP